MSEQKLTSHTPDYRNREVCPPHLFAVQPSGWGCVSCDHWVASACHVTVDQLYARIREQQ